MKFAKLARRCSFLFVFATAAGIASAQLPAYTASRIISFPSVGYANASFNGQAAVMDPILGLRTAVFFIQDGLQFTGAWNDMLYGTKFQGSTVAPFQPGPIISNRTVFSFGAAWGACAGQVVGYSLTNPPGAFNGSGGAATFQTPWHATLWGPMGEGGVDLHNANNNSRALACDGVRQVGEADNGPDFSGTMNATFGSQHAVMWSGTAKSEVDLHGGPFSNSQANGISGAVQVGWGGTTKEVQVVNGLSAGVGEVFTFKQLIKHAVMWTGSPGSIKDMNPAGYEESSMMAIGQLNAVGIIAGWARPRPAGVAAGTLLTTFQQFEFKHAMVWTANGVIDLHQFLPPDFITSYALGIDPITRQIVGGAQRATDPQPIPIAWTPNP